MLYNLVVDENSATEALCNLMQFPAFRRSLLSRLLSEECASEIEFSDIKTQEPLPGNGQPDIAINSDALCGLIEVKLERDLDLTPHQTGGYFEYLCKQQGKERWLAFLVPRYRKHRPWLESELERLKGATRERVNTNIGDWEAVLEVLEDSNLRQLNHYFDDFYELLSAWFKPSCAAFSASEVHMLFSKEVGGDLLNLSLLFKEVCASSGRWGYRAKTEPHWSAHFFDAKRKILWFGIWFPFWKKEGFPLAFGVDDSWGPASRNAFCEAFRKSAGTEPKLFEHNGEKWTLGWIPAEVLTSQNPLDASWNLLSPVLKAVAGARKG
jgi:hypothetical protein